MSTPTKMPPGPMPPETNTALPDNLRHLVSDDEFGGIVHTILDNNPGMADAIANRIAVEGLKFVATAAQYPTAVIAPSPVTDEGWHAWVLHTRLYRRVCGQLGRFVHHYPERPGDGAYEPGLISHTLATMADAGYPADTELWVNPTESTIPVAAKTWHTPAGPNCTPIKVEKRPKPKPGKVAARA